MQALKKMSTEYAKAKELIVEGTLVCSFFCRHGHVTTWVYCNEICYMHVAVYLIILGIVHVTFCFTTEILTIFMCGSWNEGLFAGCIFFTELSFLAFFP